MRLSVGVAFERDDRDRLTRIRHLVRFLTPDEARDGAPRKERKKDDRFADERLWNTLCDSREPHPLDRVERGCVLLGRLILLLREQALESGWPAPTSEVEAEMVRVLTAEREQQLLEVMTVAEWLRIVMRRLRAYQASLDLVEMQA